MNSDDQFLPETVDQQIEHYLVQGENSIPARQTVQELQKLLAPQPQSEALNRVWMRLTQYRTSSPPAKKQMIAEEKPLLVLGLQYTKGKQMSQTTSSSLKNGRIAHNMALLAAVLFLTLLVGSMAVVFQLASKRHDPNNGGTASPMTKDILYALSGNTAYALDGITHEPLWKYQLPMHTSKGKPDFSHTPIKVVNGVYYVWWNYDTFYAINAKNGSFLWKYKTTKLLIGDFQADSRGAYIAEETGTIKTFDATTGKILWQKSLNGGFGATVESVSHNVLYVSQGGVGSFNIYAFNTRDGSQLWKQSQPGLLNETGGYVDKGTFYITVLDGNVGNTASNIYAYDAMTGQLKWQKRYNHDTRLTVASNGILYMIAYASTNKPPHTSDMIYVENAIEALSARDGSLLWKYAGPDGVSDPTVGDDGSMYVALVNEKKNSGAIVVLDAKTGKTRWTHALTGKPTYIIPAVIENAVAVGTAGGKINILQSSGNTTSTIILDDKLAQRYQDIADVTVRQ